MFKAVIPKFAVASTSLVNQVFEEQEPLVPYSLQYGVFYPKSVAYEMSVVDKIIA